MTTNATEPRVGTKFRCYAVALSYAVKDRMRRGAITLTELAEAADMRKDYLSHCLRGIRPLSVDTLNKIAPVLCTTTEQIHREARALCD